MTGLDRFIGAVSLLIVLVMGVVMAAYDFWLVLPGRNSAEQRSAEES